MFRSLLTGTAVCSALLLPARPAEAQRAGENAVTAADDAFGTQVGAEVIGLYDAGNVRGFSPVAAGNIRVEGLSVVEHGGFTQRILAGSAIRVGVSAQGYPFAAPTGIADYRLRRAGDESVLSTVGYFGPTNSRALDVDGQLPLIAGKLGLAAGVTRRHDETFPGASTDNTAVGAVLRWRPSEDIEMTPFLGRLNYWNMRALPLIFTAGGLPPRIPRRYFGTDWAEGREIRLMTGNVISARVTEGVRLQAGMFHWDDRLKNGFQEVYSSVTAGGEGDHQLVAVRDQRSTSTSGEMRVSLSGKEGPRRHTVRLDVKGRLTDRKYGGAAVANLGRGRISEPSQAPDPHVTPDAPLSRDHVRQITLGAAYEGQWRSLADVSLTVQKSFYQKRSVQPAAPEVTSRDSPLLLGASGAFSVTPRLALWAGYTQGFEESGIAPVEAVNRNSPTPPIRTSQRDVGLRLKVRKLSLVAGLFEVEKPYFTLDTARVFRQLGSERHRGFELSISGQLAPGLQVVAGAVLLDARVSGEAVQSGIIGRRPIGVAGRTGKLNLDWQPGWLGPVSLNLGVNHLGPRWAGGPGRSLDGKQFTVPGRTTFDLGARYRMKFGGMSSTLRVQVTNLFDRYGWDVSSSGSYRFSDQRRVTATLSTDL